MSADWVDVWVFPLGKLRKRLAASVVHVSVEGEIDLAVAGPLERALVESLVGTEDAIVDLTRLAFIDVAGLRALAHVAASLEGDGRGVRCLVAAGTTVEVVFAMLAESFGLRWTPHTDEATEPIGPVETG